MLSGMVARDGRRQRLGPLDKALGLAFGAARGAFVVCAAYLVVSYLIKPDLQPDWVRNACLIGPVRRVRAGSRLFCPRPTGRRPARSAAGHVEGQGYTDEQRQALDKLVSPQP